jgi:hypothetical protein
MKTDAEEIILHMELWAMDTLQPEDEIQATVQTLREALSTCQVKTVVAEDVADKRPLSQVLIATLLTTSFPNLVDCLQRWTIDHYKQYGVSVKARYNDTLLESDFPLHFHNMDVWGPLYRRFSR